MEAGRLHRSVTGKLRIYLGHQQERALKSVVLVLQVAQRLEEEPCRHKQQKRHHYLANNQRSRPPSRRTASGTGSAVCGTQRVMCRSACGGNGGGEPEQNSGDDRNAEGEQQNSRIRRRAHGNPRTTLAHKCNQNPCCRESNCEPQKAAPNRQQQSFDEALPGDPRPA